MKKNKGINLWKKAKKIIPGGNMLFSKRSELFVPDKWISYYNRSRGSYLWDLNNKKYLDMMFYVGTCTLGYNNKSLNNYLKKILNQGVMTSLNCKEEVALAEELVGLHKWSDMARFCRSGGEANSVAVRIARAASGKDNVAVCGYHGWHDWYLSANLNSGSLDTHIIEGLPIKGVPKTLKNTTFTFEYNNFSQLKKIVDKKNIGVIKMEVARTCQPKDNFLQKVRDLATKKKIVLIFDECTSGFRQSLGGMHKIYGVEPDMAMFGKALGNGHAITAVIGKREIMEEAQNSFISSTFWTERIGPAAGLKTIELMKKMKSWKILPRVGKKISAEWEKIFKIFNIKYEVFGTPAMPCFQFLGKNSNFYKTIFTYLMMQKNILASNIVFTSVVHDDNKILKNYFDSFYEVIKFISDIDKGKSNNKSLIRMLKKKSAHTTFKRLN